MSKYLFHEIFIIISIYYIRFTFFRKNFNLRELTESHLRTILIERIEADSYEYAAVQSLI